MRSEKNKENFDFLLGVMPVLHYCQISHENIPYKLNANASRDKKRNSCLFNCVKRTACVYKK